MEPIPITDPLDPRIAAYRDVRERDLVGRQGKFIAEGKVVLAVLLSAGRFAVESVLVLDSRVDGLADILRAASPGLPVYVAEAAVIDRIAGFHLHRGILAVGHLRKAEAASTLLARLGRRALVLGLVGIANHDNMGSLFRNAAAFGAGAVLLDDACCDPLYRKSIRVSVGAALKVPFARAGTAAQLVALLVRHGFEPIALSPQGVHDIRGTARHERMALLLGSEGDGLPAELLAGVVSVRIAIADGFDSLNVAAASAIALHRLAG